MAWKNKERHGIVFSGKLIQNAMDAMFEAHALTLAKYCEYQKLSLQVTSFSLCQEGV